LISFLVFELVVFSREGELQHGLKNMMRTIITYGFPVGTILKRQLQISALDVCLGMPVKLVKRGCYH